MNFSHRCHFCPVFSFLLNHKQKLLQNLVKPVVILVPSWFANTYSNFGRPSFLFLPFGTNVSTCGFLEQQRLKNCFVTISTSINVTESVCFWIPLWRVAFWDISAFYLSFVWFLDSTSQTVYRIRNSFWNVIYLIDALTEEGCLSFCSLSSSNKRRPLKALFPVGTNVILPFTTRGQQSVWSVTVALSVQARFQPFGPIEAP